MWKILLLTVCGILAAVPLVVYAKPIDNDESVRLYENKILEMLEDIRLRMCYDDPEGLSQLEPLVLNSQYDVNFVHETMRLKAFIKNIKVEGLSRFMIDLLTFSLTLNFNVGVTIPRLVITGEYGLDSNLAGYLKVNGEGPFRLEFGGISLNAKAAFVYQQKLMLRNLNLKPELKSLGGFVDGLTANQLITEFINEIASNAIPELVNKHIPPELMTSLQTSLEDLASGYLEDFTVADLLAIISGSGGVGLPPIDWERACKVEQKTNSDYEDYDNDYSVIGF